MIGADKIVAVDHQQVFIPVSVIIRPAAALAPAVGIRDRGSVILVNIWALISPANNSSNPIHKTVITRYKRVTDSHIIENPP